MIRFSNSVHLRESMTSPFALNNQKSVNADLEKPNTSLSQSFESNRSSNVGDIFGSNSIEVERRLDSQLDNNNREESVSFPCHRSETSPKEHKSEEDVVNNEDLQRVECREYSCFDDQDKTLPFQGHSSNIAHLSSAQILPSEISPMELFVEDMKSESIEIRLSAVNNLKSIANALGPSKTENELIPFIANNIQDEDEIFFSLANQLTSIVDCIVDKKKPMCLMQLFDVLMSIEEGCVRRKSIESFKEIVKNLDQNVIDKYFYPFVVEMANVVWFPKKISACQLIVFLFPLVSTDKKFGLLKAFGTLLIAEMPLVRRNAVVNLSEIASNIYNSDIPIPNNLSEAYKTISDKINTTRSFLVYHFFLNNLGKLINDEQDTIRVLAVEQLFQTINLINSDLTNEAKETILLPLVLNSLSDKSWRVRAILTKTILNFNKIFPEKLFNQVAAAKYIEFLRDSENEVKVRALSHLPDFIETLPTKQRKGYIINEVLPKIHTLMNSKHLQIKIHLSRCIIALSKYLTKSELTNNFLNLYMILLRDENSEISLATISKLCEMGSDTISMHELFSCIFDAIYELSRDSKWRVRDDIVKLLPSVIIAIGFDNECCEKLIKTLIGMLLDNVYAIRRSVANSIHSLVDKQGIQWANNTVIPMINEMKNSHNYIVRMAYIDNIDSLSDCLDFAVIVDIFESLKELANDLVPNVRFRLIRYLTERLYPLAISSDDIKHQKLKEDILGLIEFLSKDPDNDVNDFLIDFKEKFCV